MVKRAPKPTAKKTTKPTAKTATTRAPAAKAWSTVKARPAAVKKGPEKKGAAKKASARRPEPPPPSEFDAQIARIEKRAARAGVVLPDGASEQEIAAAEKALGRTLPAEVRAYYRRHNGAGDFLNFDVVEGRQLLSLKAIVSEWKVWRELLEKDTFASSESVVKPGPGVQKRWWIWEWVPVTYDGAGNHHVLDLAPARGGAYGQILSFWHDQESRTVVGKSFLGWLEKAEWGQR